MLNTVFTVYFLGSPENCKTSPYLKPLIPSIVNDASNGNIGAVNCCDFRTSGVGYFRYSDVVLRSSFLLSESCGSNPYLCCASFNSVIALKCVVS